METTNEWYKRVAKRSSKRAEGPGPLFDPATVDPESRTK